MTAGSSTASPPTSWPFEGDSHVEFFPGNYQEYEADKKKRLGEEGAKPKRVRFKSLK